MDWSRHKIFETNSIVLLIGILIVVSIGGIVEIAPLFWLSSTIEKVQGMRPYTPLEQVGRDIYIREGCYLCHSQMIRSLRDEVERLRKENERALKSSHELFMRHGALLAASKRVETGHCDDAEFAALRKVIAACEEAG